MQMIVYKIMEMKQIIVDKIMETKKKRKYTFLKASNTFFTTEVCSYTKVFPNNIKEFLKVGT